MADRHDDVRAWLAEDPAPKMPDDVAARVYAALDREVEARDSEPEAVAASAPANVTPLRRPGRWKAPLLAAAGVVAVVAIGVPVIQQSSDSGSDDAGRSADAGAAKTYQGNSDDSQPHEAAPDSSTSKDGKTGAQQVGPALHRASFATDVRAYLSSSELRKARSAAPAPSTVRCVDGEPHSNDGVSATLDGDPAQLLIGPAGGGRSTVRAVVCDPGGPEVVARATVR